MLFVLKDPKLVADFFLGVAAFFFGLLLFDRVLPVYVGEFGIYVDGCERLD